MKKIGILYICNNGYDVFWKDFYLSCEKYFLNDLDEKGKKKIEKHYFVFSDTNSIYKPNSRIDVFKVENLGWVKNTLFRYDKFLSIKNKLSDFDFLVFFNANYLFIKDITIDEFLPKAEIGELYLSVWDPNMFVSKNFPHEENMESSAYIEPFRRRNEYLMGALNGGVALKFLEACEIMSNNIKKDLEKNIVAICHDQSHWNKFLSERKDVKILPPSYVYPIKQHFPFDKKIILRDKTEVSLSFWFKKIEQWPLWKKILITPKFIIGNYLKRILRIFNIYID